MNLKFSKVLSVICVFAMLLSCFSSLVIFADTAAVEIVTAEYDVYDGELRVLAKLPEGGASGAVVTACGAEVSGGSWMEQGDYMLFTKTGFTPATYGICNVLVTCGAVSDSVNVRFMKSFAKAAEMGQNFNALNEANMSATSDTSVSAQLTGDVTPINMISNTNNSTASIVAGYNGKTTDDKALVFKLPKAATSKLIGFAVTPASDVTSGTVEISYDTCINKANSRSSMYVYSSGRKTYTFTSSKYENKSFTSAYYGMEPEGGVFGLSNRSYAVNTWYNVRFLMNIDDFTYEFYIDNELYDYGTYSNADGKSGIDQVQWQISCKYTNADTEIAVDNIKFLHTSTGAAPSKVSYVTASGEDAVSTSLLNAEIPYAVAETMTVGLSGAIGYTDGDITLVDSENEEVNAEITVSDNKNIAVNTSSLTPGEYKVVLSGAVTSNSTAFGAPTEIPFTVVPTLALISPASDMSVKKGDKALIKACTPSAGKVSIYVDDALLISQAPDSVTKLVSAECDTTDLTLGKHEVTLVLEKADGSTEYLRGSFVVNEVKQVDITPLDTFETFVDMNDDDTSKIIENLDPYALDYFLGQKNADAALKKELRNDKVNDNAVSVYYTRQETALNGQNAVFIQDDFTAETGGRIVLEHDLYIESGTINYGLSYKETVDSVSTEYNFYPMEDTTFIGGGTIGGVAKPYNDGQWHTIKVVVDFILGQTEAYFDGEYVGSGELTSSKGDVPGFERIRLTYKPVNDTTQGTESFAFAVDNWRVYKELPVPVVESITAGGNAAEENGVISSTDTFAVKFAGKYTYSALDSSNVSLLVNGTDVDGTTVSYDKATNTLSAKAANAVAAHSDVQIIIDGGALLYDAATAAGADTVINLKVIDGSGLYANRTISKVGDNMVLSAKLDAASERSVTLIFATYSGNRLVNIDTEEVLIDGAKNIKLTLPAAGAGEARAFIWDNFTSLIPQIGVTGPVAAN